MKQGLWHKKISPFLKDLIHVHVCVHMSVRVCMYVLQMPKVARRRHWVPWSHPVWVLAAELWPLSALYH